MNIKDIVGHKDKVEHLLKAYKLGKLAHAYIFLGPQGIGKKSSALAFIKYVFCEDISYKESNGDSCSVCAECRKVSAGNHPDLIMLEPERSSIKIDMIRELKNNLHYGKYDANLRFCIINDAENLRLEAANALLKTLEEPAKDVIIILVTSKVNMLLPTIISRCQKVRFNPLTKDEIKSALISIHGLDDDRADVVSGFLQGAFPKTDKESLDKIIDLRSNLLKKIKEISINNFSGIVNLSEEVGEEEKEQLVDIIEIIKTFYRDAALIKSGISDDIINKDVMYDIRKIASNQTNDELYLKINIMNQMQGLLMANVNKRLAMESMLIELCA